MSTAQLKRGRPRTGYAVSAAERNRKYRAKRALISAVKRAQRAGVEVRGVVDFVLCNGDHRYANSAARLNSVSPIGGTENARVGMR